jgi:hypothetical protein
MPIQGGGSLVEPQYFFTIIIRMAAQHAGDRGARMME